MGPATEKARRSYSVEPVTWYCKKLTVDGTQMSPSVSSEARRAVSDQVALYNDAII